MSAALKLVVPEEIESCSDYDGGDGDGRVLVCPDCESEYFNMVLTSSNLHCICSTCTCEIDLLAVLNEP